ncbi:rhomboid-related protein 2-like [Biomphalaria glabrata]|uniref:Rhomboid-related protein 2-like n=1 Tax=Biomphalaria glabrata TaxID=6526 RepID=A0A9W3BE21_BIOGL|nr:rhomboid-related protein 2-like [Biomphalaria glabrata]
MGSRWRDMLMDYGNVLGDKSSRSSSAYFSVNGDLMDKRNEDVQLRQTLEVFFRPLFQKFVYGGEKIACHDLRSILREPEYRDRLPPDKVHELADLCDFNQGRAVKYEEFAKIVLGKHDDNSSFGGSDTGLHGADRDMGRTKGALRVVCTNTTQQLMVDDYLFEYKCLPPPFFMIGVTIAQIIVYIVFTSQDGWYTSALDSIPNANHTNVLMYYPNRRHEAWRYVSYWLLHQGFIDLIFNVIIQLVLGVPLEIMFKWWRLAIVWILGVLAGSLGQSLTDHYVGLAGAGGGAYAIMAAHCLTLWQERHHLNDDPTESRTKKILCGLPLRVTLMVIILIPQIALAVYRRWFLDPINIRVGIAAHIGGILAGITLGPAYLKDIKRYPWQEGSGLFSLFTCLIFIGGTVIFNIIYKGYPAEIYN